MISIFYFIWAAFCSFSSRFRILSLYVLSISGGLFCSTALPTYSQETEISGVAAEYLSEFSPGVAIYIWPGKSRTFEIINSQEFGDDFDIYIEKYNEVRDPYFKMVNRGRYPDMSINIYSGSPDVALDDFMKFSKMPDAYKDYVSNLDVGYKPCSLSKNVTRRTWAAHGVIFIDVAAIDSLEERVACLQAGLDYLNGFPVPPGPDFPYTDFPKFDIRGAILNAIYICSLSAGVADSDKERSMDGYTPLPDLGCVTSALQN